MSGTASIGNRVKFQAPNAAAPNAKRMTSQRCRIEKARMASIMLGLSLAHLGLHHEAVFGDVALAGGQPRPDLHVLRIGFSEFDRPRLDLVPLLADEYD